MNNDHLRLSLMPDNDTESTKRSDQNSWRECIGSKISYFPNNHCHNGNNPHKNSHTAIIMSHLITRYTLKFKF